MIKISSTERQLKRDESVHVKNPSLCFSFEVEWSCSCKELEICLCKLLLKAFRDIDSTASQDKLFKVWYAW